MMEKESYLKLPEKEYQKGDCLYFENTDNYFHENDDFFIERIGEYCADTGKNIDNIQIFFCKQNFLADVDIADWLKDAYEDLVDDEQCIEGIIAQNKEIYEAYLKFKETIENLGKNIVISFTPYYTERYKWSQEELQELKELIKKKKEAGR